MGNHLDALDRAVAGDRGAAMDGVSLVADPQNDESPLIRIQLNSILKTLFWRIPMKTMNTSTLRTLSLAVALIAPLALAAGCAENGRMGTSQEVAHSEKD